MSTPITAEEAEGYARIREVSARSLYRQGTRRRLSADEPQDQQLLIAHVASRLTDRLTNAAMASLGPERIVRLASTLIDDLPEETTSGLLEIINRQDEPADSINNVIGEAIVEGIEPDQIKQTAALQLPVRITEDATESNEQAIEALESRLGDSPFFRSEYDPSSDSDPSNHQPSELTREERQTTEGRIQQLLAA